MNILDHTATQYVHYATGFPSFTSIAESEVGKSGAKAELMVRDKVYLLNIDSTTGKYSWAAPEAFADGNYSVSLRFIDSAGNFGPPSLFSFVIDQTAPEAPDLIKIYDDFGSVQHGLEPGDTTDDKRPTFSGLAQAGVTVYLLNSKNERIGSAVADKLTGKWVLEPAKDLLEGSNSLRLVAEETFASILRAGAPSDAFTLIIDSQADRNPIIDYAEDNVGTVRDSLYNGDITDDTTPTLAELAQPTPRFLCAIG